MRMKQIKIFALVIDMLITSSIIGMEHRSLQTPQQNQLILFTPTPAWLQIIKATKKAQGEDLKQFKPSRQDNPPVHIVTYVDHRLSLAQNEFLRLHLYLNLIKIERMMDFIQTIKITSPEQEKAKQTMRTLYANLWHSMQIASSKTHRAIKD